MRKAGIKGFLCQLKATRLWTVRRAIVIALRKRARRNTFVPTEPVDLVIGIGTYLGEWNEATDERYCEAVERAVELGVNVIDSASNYRFQRSERVSARRSGA